MTWFNLGDRVKTKYCGPGTIVKKRKIDIDVHPLSGEPTDGYEYRVEVDDCITSSPFGRLLGKAFYFYANEIKAIEKVVV